MPPKPLCSVEECPNESRHRGLCGKHYHRLMRHGSPTGGGPTRGHVRIDLNRRIEKFRSLPRDEWPDCREELDGDPWRYNKTKYGYPTVDIDGGPKYVHRIMCMEFHGNPSSGSLEVRHLCGAGHLGCINPKCLRWGTRSENGLDKRAHGTVPLGERTPNSKLSAEEVVEILRMHEAGGITQAELGRRYGVTHMAINDIIHGRNWSWLTGKTQDDRGGTPPTGRDTGEPR